MRTTGSRKRPTFSMTVINLLTCASEGSRWYGVGSTRSIGSATSNTGVPPNGSLYDPSTAPPSVPTSDVSSRVRESTSRTWSMERPIDPAAAFLRRVVFRFFAIDAHHNPLIPGALLIQPKLEIIRGHRRPPIIDRQRFHFAAGLSGAKGTCLSRAD